MDTQDVIHLTDATFRAEVLEAATPVLVDFWAPWCGPCRAVAPVVAEIARDYEGRVSVGKLNVDENPETATAYGIRSIPTIALFKDGRVIDGVMGAVPKAYLAGLLDRHVAPAAS